MQQWQSSLLGVALGGILAILSNFAASWWTERIKSATERRQIAAALGGELAGILSLIKYRKMIETLERCANESRREEKLIYLTFSVSQTYFPVFESNVNRIGNLPAPLAHSVSEIYIFMKGILEDLKTMREPAFNAWPVDFGISFIENLADTTRKVQTKAERLIPLLEQESRRTIWNELDDSLPQNQ